MIVQHYAAIRDCGIPSINSNNITITYNLSTATLKCREGLFPTDTVTLRCYDNGTWIPNPADFRCTSNTSPGATVMLDYVIKHTKNVC